MTGRRPFVVAALLLGTALSGCNGSSSNLPTANLPAPTGGINNTGLVLSTVVSIPGLTPGKSFSYDISDVDAATRRYYLADRTNKALDVINVDSLALTQITANFTGVGASNDVSGPDGLVYVPGTNNVYVGDVNTVKVVDANAKTLVTTIATGTAGLRTDEGCFDRNDNVAMFANPADSPPYATFINTTTNTVIATLQFSDSAGLEACTYDPNTKNFYINNDGTTANPNGELDVIPAAGAVAGTPQVAKAYGEGNCGPTGLALGPSDRLVVGCDAPAGSPQVTLIVDARTGATLKTLPVGGSDEVFYDSHFNRFYTASRNMTANGISGGTKTPVLGVIDAANMTLLGTIPVGSGVHSVAVDALTGKVFVPQPPTATAAGGIAVYVPSSG